MNTLWDALQASARRSPDAACIVVPPNGSRPYWPQGAAWTYGEVAGRVEALAATYAARGWGHGHRVAMRLENRPEFMLHMLALNALGAMVVPINPDYRQDDLAFLLGHAQPDLIVSIAARAPWLRQVAATVDGGLPVAEEPGLDATLPRARRAASPGAPSRDTDAVLLYTSGTTGMPKGCLIGNDYFFFAAERYLGAGGLMRVEHGAERLYNPLPLFYANSLTISNPAMILSGNAMIFPDRFHPGSWWREIVASGATMIHYLGVIPPVLLAAPPSAIEREHRVRFAVGAGIDPAQRDAFERRFGIAVVEVWGMSEVGIATAVNVEPRPEGRRSIGRPLAGVLMRAVDEEDRPLDPGRPGELVLRRDGPDPRAGLFRGYFKDEETTGRCWRNGWFHTGDVVQLEEDGTFTFLDRKKHMIRRSGQNIAAAEVEACLRGHDEVAQVAVVPVADEMREEEVLAVVVPKRPVDDPRAAAERLFEYGAPRLAYFKVPGWAIFVDTLPTTATQKLQKFALFGDDEDPRRRPGMVDLRPLKHALTKRRGEPS